MREEMWVRAENRAYSDAIQKAHNGDIMATINLQIELIDQRNLIFGTHFTRKVKE